MASCTGRASLAWSARRVRRHGTRAAAIGGEAALPAGEESKLGLDGKKLGVCARGKHACTSSLNFSSDPARPSADAAARVRALETSARGASRAGAFRHCMCAAGRRSRIGLVRFGG